MQSARILGACVVPGGQIPSALSAWISRNISRSYPEQSVARVATPQWGCVIVAAPQISGEDGDCDKKVIVGFTGYLFSTIDGKLANRPAEKLRDAYLRDGVACFACLAGNFSAAIYDGRFPRLLLVRDIAGTRPLYYACHGGFTFGSSATAVLRASGLPAIAHESMLYRYLADGVCQGNHQTLFKGIYSIPGSHYLELTPESSPKILPTRDVNRVEIENTRWGIDEAADELRTRILTSVKASASDNVDGIGVALSGGIDSCGILACLRRSLGGEARISAYSFIDGGNSLSPPFDERLGMEASASHANAEHHLIHLDASAIPRAVSLTSHIQDFPVGSPVVFAHHEMFRVAAAHGKSVMLNGHGPDAILGGSLAHVFEIGRAHV